MHEAPDPEQVTPNSSNLVMNLITDYCSYWKTSSLKNDAMGCLIQGLRIVYEELGYTTAWSIVDGRTFGNPLLKIVISKSCDKHIDFYFEAGR